MSELAAGLQRKYYPSQAHDKLLARVEPPGFLRGRMRVALRRPPVSP
jgi:hypothetical protein